MAAKVKNEIEKLVEWLELEARRYTVKNPYGLKVKMDQSQVRRRLRKLVRVSYALARLYNPQQGAIEFKDRYGILP